MEGDRRKRLGRAVVYIRVASDEAWGRTTVETQRKITQAMALIKRFGIVGEYIDMGVSGLTPPSERQRLGQLLKDIESTELDFTTVIVLSLDRVARSTPLLLEVIEHLDAANVRLIACDDDFDSASARGREVFDLLSTLHRHERRALVERAKAGRKARCEADGEIGGKLLYGYRRIVSPGGIELDPDEAEMVRLVFELRAEGHRLRWIAWRLNEIAPSPEGSTWTPTAVKRILDNAARYRGGSRNGSQVNWPAILEEQEPVDA